MGRAGEGPLFRVRRVPCDFESLRQAVIDMAGLKGLKGEVRGDPSLFLDSDGRPLRRGRIRVEGGGERVVRKAVFPLGDGCRVVYRVLRLKSPLSGILQSFSDSYLFVRIVTFL